MAINDQVQNQVTADPNGRVGWAVQQPQALSRWHRRRIVESFYA